MKEFGWSCKLRKQVDARAAVGTLRRRGFGKIRCIELEELWMQQELYKGELFIEKIKGVENTADWGMKAVGRATDYYLWRLGYEDVAGDNASASKGVVGEGAK